jgi:predicted permease
MTAGEQQDLEPVFGLIAIVPAIVLLVACANVANVLIAHNSSRRRELAMRQAVGASRGRLIRLLLLESLVLAVLSAAAGFAVSFGLTALVLHYAEADAAFSALLTPDRRTLVASTILATVATTLFGLAPAFTATKFDLLPALKEEGPTSTEPGGRARLRRAFVVVQVALSLTLVIVAGLFVKSLSRTMRVDPGFDPHGVVTASFDTTLVGYDASRRDAFMTAFIGRASDMPGVTSVAMTDILPVSGETHEMAVVSEGKDTRILAASARVSPHYFETMRLPIVRGREFTVADVTKATPVAFLNETLARRLWPGADPLGKRV